MVAARLACRRRGSRAATSDDHPIRGGSHAIDGGIRRAFAREVFTPARAFALAALATSMLAADGAADWPHARGPRFDGAFARATPLPAWPASGLAQQWEVTLGQGFSGLVVADGRIYTQHQTSGGQELLCLEVNTGAVRWRSRYAFPWEMDGRYPGPYGTPTVAGGRVYFADCYGVLACANAADGAILWRFDAVKQLNPAGVDFGYAAAPLVLGDRVFAPAPAAGGGVAGFCLDAATGAIIWRAGNSVPSYASFTPITVGSRECLLLPLRNGLAIYDRKTGEELWKEEWTRGYDEHSCWAVYQEPLLFFPSAFRRAARVYKFALQDGKLQGDTVWEERVLSNDVFSSALVDGHLYGFDVQSQQSELLGRTRGSLKCVDFATGAVRWTQTGIKHCSVTRVGSQLLVLEDEGDLVLVDPAPEAYRELARFTLPQKPKIWATPVVVGDRVLIRARDSLACYALVPASVTPQARSAVATKTAPARKPAPAIGERIRGWFERYRSDVFIAPSNRILAEWYVECVVLLIAATTLFGRGEARRVRWPWIAFTLGLAGTFVLTLITEKFQFTAPLGLFALFCVIAPLCANPTAATLASGRSRAMQRLRLVAFVAVCYGYYRFCGSVFLVSGWGFLAGFPALVALAWAAQRISIRRQISRVFWRLGWPVLAFTAYFWSSALAVSWSAK